MLEQCNDNELYDVVIKSKHKCENLKSIRMRYLNYIYNYYDDYELTLNHPEDLISLSTHKVKITNMNKCVNLRNLSSYRNTYNRDDIVPLKNLHRIQSINDEYEENDNCFIYDLFASNKLEYVHVINWREDSNIVNSFVIRENIENLRYIYVS